MNHIEWDETDTTANPLHETPPEGICEQCGKECNSICIDNGIGTFEFCGHKETQHKYQWVSDCCKAMVLDKEE